MIFSRLFTEQSGAQIQLKLLTDPIFFPLQRYSDEQDEFWDFTRKF